MEEALQYFQPALPPKPKKPKKPRTREQLDRLNKQTGEAAKRKRAMETPEEAKARRALRLAKMKAAETPEKKKHRQEREAAWHKKKNERIKATETPEEKELRLARYREYQNRYRDKLNPNRVKRGDRGTRKPKDINDKVVKKTRRKQNETHPVGVNPNPGTRRSARAAEQREKQSRSKPEIVAGSAETVNEVIECEPDLQDWWNGQESAS